MSKLQAYFAETGDTASGLAAKVGRAVSTITRPLRGERNVSMDLALDIERATEGRVTAADFLAACVEARRKASGKYVAEAAQ
jgi:DNA-binding transcriptional regulator YdaS (Cro superfamily)